MKKMTSFLKNLWKDESGQGATEYIILLVVVVAVVVIFKDKILTVMRDRVEALGGSLGAFSVDSLTGGQ